MEAAQPDSMLSRAQAGDRDAQAAVFAHHQKLIWHVLRRWFGDYAASSSEAEDLFQVGAMGLVKAIQRFDPDRGTQFATYAVPLILGEIRRHLRDNQPVHIPRALGELAQRLAEAREQLSQELGRDPFPSELAARLGTDVAAVVEALESRHPVLSLEAPLKDAGDGSEDLLSSHLKSEAPEAKWVVQMMLQDALNRLTDRERWILSWRFSDGMTQARVAQRLGISQVQVSRLERQALAHLRHRLGSDASDRDAPILP